MNSNIEIKDFGQRYLEAERELRRECDQMVEDGELEPDEARFRFMMVRDEILEAMAAAEFEVDE